jgi:hypothetical protein
MRATVSARIKYKLAFPTLYVEEPPANRALVELFACDDYPIPLGTKKKKMFFSNLTISEHTPVCSIFIHTMDVSGEMGKRRQRSNM